MASSPPALLPCDPERAKLALDTILQKPVRGIPTWTLFLMEWEHIERIAGAQPGNYQQFPEKVYLNCQRAAGACLVDQFIPRNPLTMGKRGYEGTTRGATTGAEEIVVDGMVIDSPEAVVQHLESVVFPQLRNEAVAFDEDARATEILTHETAIQDQIGPEILKSGHGFVRFPGLAYGTYGYVNYFSAYALYPEVIEQHFSLQADVALANNRAAARAYRQGNLPPLYRLDHDMADSRGTLVHIETLDRMWLPHFARCLEPLIRANVKLIWHCDGNLIAMVPRLIEVGIKGFQGFQYETGMDYDRICRMRTRDGDELIIFAGVSVTRTLPMGTPTDVKREIDWLVEHGPKAGLFLGGSSSIVPGTPWENMEALLEGFRFYRTHGRG